MTKIAVTHVNYLMCSNQLLVKNARTVHYILQCYMAFNNILLIIIIDYRRSTINHKNYNNYIMQYKLWLDVKTIKNITLISTSISIVLYYNG